MSDKKFNLKYNKVEVGQSSNDLFNVSSKRKSANTTEITLDLNEEKLAALYQQKQKERQAEINSFQYIPALIQRQGLQLLESISILNSTKSLDTLTGRFQFIETHYDNFVKASYNKRFVSDIQVSIDQYKSMYYDRVLKDFEIQLVLQPDHDGLIDYYSECLFHCFNLFYDEQTVQINSLKREDAKTRRIEKIAEIGEGTLNEFDKNRSDNEKFKPHVQALNEKLDKLGVQRNGAASISPSIDLPVENPVVINPKSSFELTLYNAPTSVIKEVSSILKDENIWNKRKQLLPLFTAHNIKCKEIEAYILEYKPKLQGAIENFKNQSVEYQSASEMNKVEIENEFAEKAYDQLDERPFCDLEVLFSGSEIPETIDDELIQVYGFDTISKYIGLNHKKGKIITNWDRKDFEDLLENDLAISGDDLPKDEILLAQPLKLLNILAEQEDQFFKRKQKAVDYLNENPELMANIGKHIATRSMFKLKPLPEKFNHIEIDKLSLSWAYVREYIQILEDTFKYAEYHEQNIKDKNWVDKFRIDKAEDYNPNLVCQRARKECQKEYSKSRLPKMPFHVGCTCQLRPEI